MKFSINRKLFIKYLTKIKHVTEEVYIHSEPNTIVLSKEEDTVKFKINLPAKIYKHGEVGIGVNLLKKYIIKLKSETIKFTVKDYVIIEGDFTFYVDKCGISNRKPEIKEIKNCSKLTEIKKSVLKKIIDKTVNTKDTNHLRHLQHIFLKDNYAVATTGHVLEAIKIPTSVEGFIHPSAIRLIPDKQFKIYKKENSIYLIFKRGIVTTTLDASYPDWKSVKFKNDFEFKAPAVKNIVTRIKDLGDDLEIEYNKKLKFTLKDFKTVAKFEVPVKYQKGNFKIATRVKDFYKIIRGHSNKCKLSFSKNHCSVEESDYYSICMNLAGGEVNK